MGTPEGQRDRPQGGQPGRDTPDTHTARPCHTSPYTPACLPAQEERVDAVSFDRSDEG